MFKQVIDGDDVNTINNEYWAEQKELHEKKLRILSLFNVDKKQDEWNKLFPPTETSDDYLLGNVF